MYLDEIEKLQYLRDRVASTLVAQEVFPDRTAIDKRLADIDTKLALFQYVPVKENDKLDVAKLNNDFMAIYQDLLILYKLVYYFISVKFNRTKSYVDTHLAELEAYADRYSRKAEFETSNVTVGKTVFFQGNGFRPQTANFKTTLDLGKVKVSKGSRVTFHIKGKDFNKEDVVFKLDDMRCSDYSVNHDFLEIPGGASRTTVQCNVPEDINRDTTFPLTSPGFTPIINNKYVVYGGQNKICSTTGNQETFYTKDVNNGITLKERRGRVSFYVLGGTYIDFDFSQAPISQNFVGHNVQGLKERQLITFEYDGSNFSFNFITDGTVYAVRRRGAVKGDTLYYPKADNDIYDFLIEEYSSKDTAEYNLTVTIKQPYLYEPYIEMVAVKESSALDEVSL